MRARTKLALFLFVVAVAIIIVLLTLDRGLAFDLLVSQSMSYNYTYGTFTVLIYNPAKGVVERETIRGILLYINNIDDQNLQIVAVSNSTYSITPAYYVAVPVPLPNGSVVQGFERSYNIYIGYEEVLIPTTGLSPGNYIIELNDGITIPVTIP